ncbi:MAG: hypothetical protein U5L10_03945 [Candidatus Moranbacteria bacterium]|nr:hypothetical protein [Candidatus Moranbacteria bacterium]
MRKIINILLGVLLGFTFYCLILTVFFVPPQEGGWASDFDFKSFSQKDALTKKVEWRICPQKFSVIAKLPVAELGIVRKVRIVDSRLCARAYEDLFSYYQFELQESEAENHFLSL